MNDYYADYIGALVKLRDLCWTAADQCHTLAAEYGLDSIGMMANEWNERFSEYAALLASSSAARTTTTGGKVMTTPKTYTIVVDSDGSSQVTIRRRNRPNAYANLTADGTQHVVDALNAWQSARQPSPDAEQDPVVPLPLVSPGEVLYDELLERYAKELHLSVADLRGIITGQIEITGGSAAGIALGTGTSTLLWLALEGNYRSAVAARRAG